MTCRRWLASFIVVMIAGPALGQVVAPPPPAEYDAELRYRIRATRNQRIEQYTEMIKALERAGLKLEVQDDPDATDPQGDRLHSKLPSSSVPAVMAAENVRSILLKPTGFPLPAGDNRVTIRVTISAGLDRDRQRLLHSQTNQHLSKLGFASRVGYDHRGFTTLFGSIPVEQLTNLLADIRFQPSGWLAADAELEKLPEPLRSHDPVRVIEVLDTPSNAVADASVPAVETGMEKLSVELRALLREEGASAKPTRMEVVLFHALRPEIQTWRAWLLSAGVVSVEGHIGQTVTVLVPAGAAKKLAALPQVASVRLPAKASEPIPSGDTVSSLNALSASHLDQLHNKKVRGQGISVAIIDSDFSGIKRFLGRSIPSSAIFIDMTAERNPTLEPDALPTDRLGRGTLSALAAARAAPQARFILVRVDAAAAYQLGSIARYISGESFRTEAMDIRHSELLLDNERLRQARELLTEERRVMSDNYDSEDATQKKRIELEKRLSDQTKFEAEYSTRLARFIAMERDLHELKKTQVVACNLSWNNGYATDGTSALSQYLDGPAHLQDRGRRLGPVTWLQSAGDTHGQTWAGPTRDADGNGVFEFADAIAPVRVGSWTRELNFLSWQPTDRAPSDELPAGSKLRLTLQWTEAQDTSAPVSAERYRTPLNDFRPMLVRQRDPIGKKTSSDDLVIVAQAVKLPQLMGRTKESATFESTIEFTVNQAGQYAVRLEGKLAAATTPPELALPPAARQSAETFPRLFVDTIDQNKGRPVFRDYRTIAGGMAMPSDAHSVVVVGAANAAGHPQDYSALGSSPSLALVGRPSVMAFDELTLGNLAARGTATANGFAAGMVAAMLSGGGPASYNLGWLQIPSGGLMVVPLPWLEQRSGASHTGVAYPSSLIEQPSLHNR